MILIYLLPSVRALKVAAHNFVEPTVTEHERLELEAARSQQVNGLLVLVRKPELTRIELGIGSGLGNLTDPFETCNAEPVQEKP
jgi:hypothetical protein